MIHIPASCLVGIFFARDQSLEYLEIVYNHWKKYAYWIVIITVLLCLSSCQLKSQSSHLIILDEKKEKISFPFDLVNGLIIVKAKLGGFRDVNMLLDTGAENLILFNRDIKKELDIPDGKEVVIKGADLIQKISGQICRNILITLPNNTPISRDFIILDENFLNFNESIGVHIDGLMGGRLFWGSVMEINYKKRTITFYKKNAFTPPTKRGFQRIPIGIEDHKPYITSEISLFTGTGAKMKLLLDTGSSLGILLFINEDKEFQLPEKFVEGPLGIGLGGDIIGYQAKFKSLNITNSLFFNSVVANYQVINEDLDKRLINNRNGLIGNPILSRFHVIIDYVSSELYLKPLKNYNKNLEYDKSGLVVYAAGKNLNQFVIRYVIKNTPAHKAGLQTGDIIKRIGWTPTRILSLASVNRKLDKKEGKKVKMIIIREGKKLRKSFILEDYLSVPDFIY